MRFEMIILGPTPVIAPGLIVQVPVSGKPFNITLPVVEVHDEGCVIVPSIGAVGATGAGLITTSADACEIQPGSL